MTETNKLITKLAAVMEQVGRVPKTERNPQGWYFASVMDMLDVIRPKFAAAGLVLVPDTEDVKYSDSPTRSGGTQTTCILTVRWTLYEAETGGSISFRTIGEAADTSDKATNKAFTAAQKQAVSKLVMMSTGDDPDADHIERAPRTPLAEVAKGVARDRGDGENYCEKHKSRWFDNHDGSWSHSIKGGAACFKLDDNPPLEPHDDHYEEGVVDEPPPLPDDYPPEAHAFIKQAHDAGMKSPDEVIVWSRATIPALKALPPKKWTAAQWKSLTTKLAARWKLDPTQTGFREA